MQVSFLKETVTPHNLPCLTHNIEYSLGNASPTNLVLPANSRVLKTPRSSTNCFRQFPISSSPIPSQEHPAKFLDLSPIHQSVTGFEFVAVGGNNVDPLKWRIPSLEQKLDTCARPNIEEKTGVNGQWNKTCLLCH